MAKITLSKLAPHDQGVIQFALANDNFKLDPSDDGAVFEVDNDDRVLLSNAREHPWLVVEVDAPQPDETPAEETVRPVAIDADRKQDSKVSRDGISRTLAADAKAREDVND